MNMKKVATAVLTLMALCLPVSLFAGQGGMISQPTSNEVRIKKLSIEDRMNVQAPKIVVYKTQYKEGTQIRFDHTMHSVSYGLQCITCHHVEKCAHCHGTDTGAMMVEESKIALHETCMGCHRMMESGPRKCDDCHKPTQ